MISIEARLNEALTTITHRENVIVSLKEELRQARMLIAQIELEGRIASLPTDAKERLRKAFPGTDLGGLKQAVNVEKRGKR
jgi:hypothetical protein